MESLDSVSRFTERQLVTFYLGNDEFGSDIMNVKEIVRISEITKIPNTPSYIEGVCNLRGNVLPIIDGRTRFNMDKKQKDSNSRVIVIDINGKSTGIIVDKVSEVMSVGTSDIEPPPEIIKSVDVDYLNGVVKLEGGKRLIMVLNLTKVLQIEETEFINSSEEINNTGALFIEEKKEKIEEEQLVSFLVEKEEYAINIMQVKEIIRVPEIVKVPSSEKYIEGVVSIRNHLLPIISLRKYFDMKPKEITDHTRILIGVHLIKVKKINPNMK